MPSKNASQYLAQKILGHTLLGSTFTAPTTVWLSLATSINSDGDSYTEVTTGIGYGRLPIDFSEPTSIPDNSVVNSASLTFSPATTPWGVVAHFGIYDAEAVGGGNLLYWGTWDASRDVTTGVELVINAGELYVRVR